MTGVTITVKGNTGILVKAGSTFAGWNTTADGSGTAYAAGATFAMGTVNDTLFARWPTNPMYTVVYNGNGFVGGTVPVDAGSYEAGMTVTVKSNTGILVKPGSTFAGWNTAANGSGTAYAAGAMFLMGAANDTLFAQWTVNHYTVTFDKNDSTASGTMPAQTITSGSSANLTANGFAKVRATFAGWATSAAGPVVYVNLASYTMSTANVILYAKWTIVDFTVTYIGNGQSSGTVPTSTATYKTGDAVVILANPGKLVKISASFAGWNTLANGSGTTYSCGQAILMGNQDLVLYAKYSTTSVMDNDGNTYSTVTIGSQVWMVQNLKTTKYNDGTDLSLREDPSQWGDLGSLTGGYCWYGNLIGHKDPYGALYNGVTVNTGKLAPAGWHVASDDEWTALENYLTANGYNCDPTQTDYNTIAKALAAKNGWGTSVDNCVIGNNLSQNNNSGFSAYPSGYCQGEFDYLGTACSWWTSTVQSPVFYNMIRSLDGSSSLNSGVGTLNDGRSVRCIKD